jgi:hypothetical protein
VFQNRVLKTIFGPKREEVTGGWRKLHKKELHNFYSSPNIIRIIKSKRMKWVGHVPCMAETGSTYKIFIGKPEVLRTLTRPWHRWNDNNKINLSEIGLESVNWIYLLSIAAMMGSC